MFLTVHSLVGVAIGTTTQNPILAFIGGFISHFFVDAIPHGDEIFRDPTKTHRQKIIRVVIWAGGDCLIVLSLLALLFFFRPQLITISTLAGVFGALLPDALQIPNCIGFTQIPLVREFVSIHKYFHFIFGDIRIGLKKGLSLQIAFVLFFLYLLI